MHSKCYGIYAIRLQNQDYTQYLQLHFLRTECWYFLQCHQFYRGRSHDSQSRPSPVGIIRKHRNFTKRKQCSVRQIPTLNLAIYINDYLRN